MAVKVSEIISKIAAFEQKNPNNTSAAVKLANAKTAYNKAISDAVSLLASNENIINVINYSGSYPSAWCQNNATNGYVGASAKSYDSQRPSYWYNGSSDIAKHTTIKFYGSLYKSTSAYGGSGWYFPYQGNTC